MKKILFFSLLSISLFSCSNKKKQKNEFILNLIKADSVLLVNQNNLMEDNRKKLDKWNEYILGMANADASKNVLDSIENEKKKEQQEYSKKLNEIQIDMDNNKKQMDSILKSK